jgi:Toprim-like
MTAAPQGLFADAREKFTIADAWQLLGFDGEPKSSCKSPFREDRHPSFSIYSDGRAWTDHSTGDGGDVVEFIRHAIGGDHKDVREWLRARIGTYTAPTAPAKSSQEVKAISWPGELLEGTTETWQAFAKHRGLSFPAVHAMVQAEILRFMKLKDGSKCYIITDSSRRAAEIRRMDGKPFGGSKAYPLPGVDKSWLPGIDLLRGVTKTTAVLITEGATDLLSAIDIYSRYRRNHDGRNSWQPIALLGAGCKKLHPEAESLIRGRRVRLVPDGDGAGDIMTDYWTGLLRKIGCVVDVVNLPRETDLTDHLSTLSPTDLFSA